MGKNLYGFCPKCGALGISRERLARKLCETEYAAPDPDAMVMQGMKTVRAWEARLKQADALLSAGWRPKRDVWEDAAKVAAFEALDSWGRGESNEIRAAYHLLGIKIADALRKRSNDPATTP